MIKSFVNILKFLQNWNIGHIHRIFILSVFLVAIKEDSQGINYYSSTWKIIVIRQTRRKKISSPPPQLIHAWSSTRERLGWIITKARRLYIYNNRGRLVKLSRSSKNHATHGVSMSIPKGMWMRLCCRVFSGVCAWKLYAHGIHEGHAACRPRPYLYVYTLVYIAAIVHGEQPIVDESSNPCQHRSCRCPRWVQWKLNFPPSFRAPKFLLSQKSLLPPSPHHSPEGEA